MRFSCIELMNFRSFGPEVTRIELPEDRVPLTIVGANNSGKSNLLDGFRLALGATRRRDAVPADFNRFDVSTDAYVTVHLREPLKLENVFRSTDRVAAFRFRAWSKLRGIERGQIDTELVCLKEDGTPYVPAAAVARRGSRQPETDVVPARALPARVPDVVRHLGPVHYLDPFLSDAFRTTGSGVLARLLDLYRDDFRGEHNVYKHPQAGEMRSIEAFERLTARMVEVLRTERLASIEKALSSNLETYLGPEAQLAEVSLRLPSPEELLTSALRLEVQAMPDAPAVPVDRLGAGYRSLLRLAILQAYAELTGDDRRAVFLIEEPEAYLHPHLRRACKTTLDQLAAEGHDVIVTTHDSAFVTLPQYRNILRLTNTGGASSPRRATGDLDLAWDRVARKLKASGNEEVVFARQAILSEGQDDEAVLRILLDHLKIELDSRSISVVACGSRDNIPDYIRLLEGLGIPLLVVADRDGAPLAGDGVPARVRKLDEVAGERIFWFADKLETALGTEKRGSNVEHVMELAAAMDLKGLPETHELRRLAACLLAFAAPLQGR